MINFTLADLRASILDTTAFTTLNDYLKIGCAFLNYLEQIPTRIVSPTVQYYIFFQYGSNEAHRITRPLNSNLFFESLETFQQACGRFIDFLGDLKLYQQDVVNQPTKAAYINSQEINKVVYTIQQAIGSISDSFENQNQARKRVGQLFENLIRLIIEEIGLVCEPRQIKIPIPGYPGYQMPYELDVVFSRNQVILSSENPEVVASETKYIHHDEIVGSIKTTSKDRIDKIFLDKYLLTKLLGRDIPVIAVFLHDVQRSQVRANARLDRGSSIFGINSTFKTNHFLGYTVALNKLDGVYYVDPRPEMTSNERLREQIRDFQRFLTHDLWTLSS